MASGFIISTPASFSRETGSFEQPPDKKRRVIAHRRFAFLEDAAGKGDGCRVAGRVLVDVVVHEEVRDARPFECNLIVHHHIRAEIIFVEFAVDAAQRFGGQRLSFGVKFADGFFKFRKHRLPEDGAFELFEEIVDELSALDAVGGAGQQVFHQQCFVAGGGHFRHKDHVIGIDLRLMLVGQVGMQGMPHFVRGR